MPRLLTIVGAGALLALAGCNSNKGGAEATATDTAADTDVGMGDAIASDSAMSPLPTEIPTDMAPTATETGIATLQGPGTGAPSPAVTTAPTSGARP